MTRPDELKQLDEELAAGLLTPQEYLRRRDELVPGTDQTGHPSPSSDPPKETADPAPDSAPDDAAPAAGPFPPAFRWESSPPNETTQVIYPTRDDTDQGSSSDTTQVVPRGEEHDSERTQVVQASAVPYQPPSLSEGNVSPVQSGYQQEPNHSWDSYESTPPWISTDLPPITDQQSGWTRQGPEFFEAPAERSNRKQIIGLSVVAVLVLALIGAGVAYFLSQESGTEAGDASPSNQQPNQPLPTSVVELPAPPSPRPAPVDTSAALIEPPGQPRGGGGLFDLPQLQNGDLLRPPIVSALSAGDMTEGVLKTTTQGQSTIGMFAFTLSDEQAATTVGETIARVQLDGGLTLDNDRALQGVAVLGSPQGTSTTAYRAVYVLYDRAIFFEVLGADRNAVLAIFDSLLEEQLAHAPPTVR